MVLVVTGAFLHVGNPLKRGTVTRAVVLALISNLSLGVRNVAVKIFQSANRKKNHFRTVKALVGFCACVAFALLSAFFLETAAGVLPPNATHFLLLASAPGVCHVAYSYISTYAVLRYMSVMSHALANILTRVLVVLLLHVTGRPSASQWNWAGLALCVLGLSLYRKRKTLSPSSPCVCVCLGVCVCVWSVGGGVCWLWA